MDRIADTQGLYRRGRSAAVVGLLVQLLLAVATGAAAAWSRSDALVAATWHMLGGLPIWAVLAMLYGQREAERREEVSAVRVPIPWACCSRRAASRSSHSRRAGG